MYFENGNKCFNFGTIIRNFPINTSWDIELFQHLFRYLEVDMFCQIDDETFINTITSASMYSVKKKIGLINASLLFSFLSNTAAIIISNLEIGHKTSNQINIYKLILHRGKISSIHDKLKPDKYLIYIYIYIYYCKYYKHFFKQPKYLCTILVVCTQRNEVLSLVKLDEILIAITFFRWNCYQTCPVWCQINRKI